MRDAVTMLRCSSTHDVHSQSVHVRRRSGKSPSFGFSQVVMYAYLCVPLPILSLSGSIAMIAFRHPSRFWASFGSSSCCFRSLRTRSIHLSVGLPRGLPPSSLLYVLLRSFLWAALFTFNPYLLISINELFISIIHLLISINELLISINEL